jgi:predicted house-cleaning NTP pyrophosphatase (Maf/HAM1 superfamily)
VFLYVVDGALSKDVAVAGRGGGAKVESGSRAAAMFVEGFDGAIFGVLGLKITEVSEELKEEAGSFAESENVG